MSETSCIDEFQPAPSAASGTGNRRKIVNDDGTLAFAAEEVRLIVSVLVTISEFLTMSDVELDNLKCVQRALLVRR